MYYILVFKVLNNSYFAEKMSVSDMKVTRDNWEGIRYDVPDLKIVLPATRGTVNDYIPTLYSMDVVAEEIKDLFTELGGEHLEYYEVELKRKSNKQFYFINVLDNVDCFDYEKSVYEEYEPGIKIIKKIDKLVLNEESIAGRHFFRIKDYDSEIIVSETFKKAVEERQIDILRFMPVDAYKFDITKTNYELYELSR